MRHKSKEQGVSQDDLLSAGSTKQKVKKFLQKNHLNKFLQKNKKVSKVSCVEETEQQLL